MISSISYDPDVEEVESFQFEQSKSNDLNMGIVNVTDENTQPNTILRKSLTRWIPCMRVVNHNAMILKIYGRNFACLL